MLSIEDKNIVKMFVEQTLNYSGFEALILPGSMSLCSHLEPVESLNLLSKIILHKIPPSSSVEKFQQWRRYPFDLSTYR